MILRLRTGALAGLLLSLLTYGPYFIPGQAAAWASFAEAAAIAAAILCLAAMWLVMRRQRALRGGLLFAQGLAIGLGVTCVAAAVAGAMAWLAYSIGGDIVPVAVHDAYQLQVRSGGGSGAAIDAGLVDLAAMRPLLFDPVVQAVGMAVTVLAVGTLESLLGAWALRSRPRVRRP